MGKAIDSGKEDIVIFETEETLLVMDKARSQEAREIKIIALPWSIATKSTE